MKKLLWACLALFLIVSVPAEDKEATLKEAWRDLAFKTLQGDVDKLIKFKKENPKSDSDDPKYRKAVIAVSNTQYSIMIGGRFTEHYPLWKSGAKLGDKAINAQMEVEGSLLELSRTCRNSIDAGWGPLEIENSLFPLKERVAKFTLLLYAAIEEDKAAKKK